MLPTLTQAAATPRTTPALSPSESHFGYGISFRGLSHNWCYQCYDSPQRASNTGLLFHSAHFLGDKASCKQFCLWRDSKFNTWASTVVNYRQTIDLCTQVFINGVHVALSDTSSTRGIYSKRKRRCCRVMAVSTNEPAALSSEKSNVAILWFKKDLRLDDHLGSSSCAAYQALLPVYIFDPYLLRGWSYSMLENLVEAVAELKLALQGVGSDLIIRCGNIKAELAALAEEVHARIIIAEAEIDYEWQEAVSSLQEYLKDVENGPSNVSVQTWTMPLYECKEKGTPAYYKEFQKMQCRIKPPLAVPMSFPPLVEVADRGCIPSASEVEIYIQSFLENNIWHRKLKDLQSASAEALLSTMSEIPSDKVVPGTSNKAFESFNSWRQKYILASPYEALEKRREELALKSQDREAKSSNGVGAISIMGTLEAYLRFLEPTWRKDWKQIYERVSEAEYEGPRGGSFRRLFGNSLTLGTISGRRIYYEAFEYEKARNGGWASPFGFGTFTAIAAAKYVESSEYTMSGEHGSPVVLVHGFGAFWEHYRDNIQNLAKEGYRVWALTLIGFGRSEKPDVPYTELLWAELIRDFIVEVVGEPATLVGNSIGGYMVSIVAGLWPQIVLSLILLNSAGAILPHDSTCTYLKPKQRTAITWATSQFSLLYLRSSVSQLLKKYYPVNPSKADKWLISEILRASHDPGAEYVMESFFCLKKPFPINWFLNRFQGKVFAIQGSRDPLSNGTERKQLFESYCPNVVFQSVNAGHCPHDEVPDEINKMILKWLQQIDSQQAGRTPPLQPVQSVQSA
ncbi:hypothetical protein KP509_29G036100 [Ceratopteris richardii]|uniref:Photolyase/cryptochrome alpha/beta domain-containing protein n=1 Tax=Ceratopteris richardii TaxID=49495 RepID=A0A8T2R7U3_CERRI|nr:hypothetical protein KP509_29G036100 [Ceratopteris richardii]